jgi:DNA-binding transcriptional LysR family regulator
MPVLFGRRCVAPILTRLAQRHPRLELELNFSDRRVDLIEDGFDLAVRNGPLGEGAGLTTRRIAHQRMAVVAAPAYLAAHGRRARSKRPSLMTPSPMHPGIPAASSRGSSLEKG